MDESNIVVTGFGRYNPMTVGHSLLLKKLNDIAESENADAILFVSQSQDPKKNPIPYDEKVIFLQDIVDEHGWAIEIYREHDVKTAIHLLNKLGQEGYKNVIFIAGSDRIPEFDTLFNKYNGTTYNFDSIKLVSAGERDPDSEDDLSSMSASKMRGFAKDDNLDAFAKGIDSEDPELIQDIWVATRKGMGLDI